MEREKGRHIKSNKKLKIQDRWQIIDFKLIEKIWTKDLTESLNEKLKIVNIK